MEKPQIKNSDLLSMFFRCFLVQGSWNYKSLLSMGFCYSAIPIARRLYKSPEKRRDFLLRHLEFFNAHPYYASWCLGAVARLEQEAENNEMRSKQPILIFKERVIGPLGSIGDQLFWNGLKPLLAGFGVLLAFLIGWYATLIFLIFYNLPHIYIRLYGFIKGYKKGFEIIEYLAYDHYKKSIIIVMVLGALIAGSFLVIAGKWSFDQDPFYLIVFGVTSLLTYIFLDIQKPVWLALLFSIFFSVIIKIIIYFTV